MSLTIELPIYDNETLATWTPSELIENMIRDEDRVPRNVIDECARRGEQMLDFLAPFAQADDELENETSGHWWLRLHAVMTLGLIPDEAAGMLLVDFIHNISREEYEDLQGWFSGYWPALTHNKPATTIALLRDICMDKKINWYLRSNITDAVIADALKQGEAALEQALDWLVQLAADEEQEWDYRFCIANTLLDFPRERNRELLYTLAAEQDTFCTYFSKKDVIDAYEQNKDQPEWERFSDPWQFYNPEEIESRQRRWQEESLEESTNPLMDLLMGSQASQGIPDYRYHEPYHREAPKIGRNDPCHCGSGKKYKKCCLSKEQMTLH